MPFVDFLDLENKYFEFRAKNEMIGMSHSAQCSKIEKKGLISNVCLGGCAISSMFF